MSIKLNRLTTTTTQKMTKLLEKLIASLSELSTAEKKTNYKRNSSTFWIESKICPLDHIKIGLTDPLYKSLNLIESPLQYIELNFYYPFCHDVVQYCLNSFFLSIKRRLEIPKIITESLQKRSEMLPCDIINLIIDFNKHYHIYLVFRMPWEFLMDMEIDYYVRINEEKYFKKPIKNHPEINNVMINDGLIQISFISLDNWEFATKHYYGLSDNDFVEKYSFLTYTNIQS